MSAGIDLPAWLQAFGPTIGATIVGFWPWRHDRKRDQQDRDGRALSLAISLVPVLERARYRASAESNSEAAWELFNEHPDDASEAYKILPGLPALLSDAHLLPPDIARMVHNFWAEAQKHDALVDRNKRAHALQSSDRDKLNKDLKESWCVLEEAVNGALQSVQTYVDSERSSVKVRRKERRPR